MWAHRSFFAAVEQALFATSNFVVNVLLARRLPAREYGAFVAAYAVFQLLGQVHVGMLAEPMQVFGSGKHAGRFAHYLRALLRGHCLVGGGISLVLAAVGVVLSVTGADVMGGAFLVLAAAAPFITLSWLMRTACTVIMRPDLAAVSGGLNFFLVLTGLQALHAHGRLSVGAALATLGLSSVFASAVLVAWFRVLTVRSAERVNSAEVLRDHWRYGRWSTGAGLLNWMPTDFFLLVLSFWGGLQDTAALKALTNLLQPALQTQYVLTNLLTPVFVRLRGRPQFTRTLLGASGAALIAFGGYWVLVGWFHAPLMRWVYAGRFAEQSALLWGLGALPMLAGLGAVLTSALRALERPDRVFVSAVIASGVAVACVPFVGLWGLTGVAAARVVSSLAFIATLWLFFARLPRNGRGGSPAGEAADAVATEGVPG